MGHMEEAAMQKHRRNTAKILAMLMALVMSFTAAAAFGANSVYAEAEKADSNTPAAAEAATDTSKDTENVAVDTPATPAANEEKPDAPQTSDEEKPDAPQDADEEEPASPQVTVAVKGAGLKVEWTYPAEAASYDIYRSYKAGSGWKLLKKGVKELSYQDNGTKSGKKAYYKVRARKADGSYSELSEAASGIIYRVYIETGHGRGDDGVWDPGCRWGKYQEAKLMVPICKSMAKHLRDRGVYVCTDAFTGNNINLNVTLKRIKKQSFSVLVNVHCDYKKAPRGTMPLYRYSNQKKLAKCLNKGVHEYVKIKDRGLKKRKDLKTLNKTKGKCVACLFETGNIKKDNKILRKKYDAYGKGLAKGVCDYLGIEW